MEKMNSMQTEYDLEAYAYELPESSIAQTPAANREESRLLVFDRDSGSLRHQTFADILDYFEPGDLLVANDTRVFPARLTGHKETGGRIEVFLLEYPEPVPSTGADQAFAAPCLIKSSKRPKPGSFLRFGSELRARVEELGEDGRARVTLFCRPGTASSLEDLLAAHGSIPLPPYIQRSGGEEPNDRERYQTVYASRTGAVAAPTAGLHFSQPLLAAIRRKDVRFAAITLHVGYGTFAPVRAQDIRQHQIHAEYVSVSHETAGLVNETKKAGGRIWVVGTTTARALEWAALPAGCVTARDGWCDLYIYPGYSFQVVDHLVTNFHLPRSSLLFLVAALIGRQRLLDCYQEAIAQGYRFYSYGDAMAVISRR